MDGRIWPRPPAANGCYACPVPLAHRRVPKQHDARVAGCCVADLGIRHQLGEGIEFKRLVVTRKGAGYGRAAVRLVKRAAFERQNAHRLWLDVLDFNVRARRLYETEGFVVEGTRRDCLRRGDRYVSAVIMSMLESEYRSERQIR